MRYALTGAVLLAFAVGLRVAFGCTESVATLAKTPPAVPSEPATIERISQPDSTLSVKDAEAERSLQALRLELAPVRQAEVSEPYVEIRSPVAEQLISLPKAKDQKLVLKVENWPLSKGGRSVQLSLDDFPAISSHAGELRLSELVPEDRELLPGEHLLVAILAHENGETLKPRAQASRRPFATVHFWIGQRGVPTVTADSSLLIYGLPRGTYNGPQASAAVLLDFYLIGESLAPGRREITIAIRGQHDEATLRVSALHPLLIRGLSSGDYSVELALYGATGPVEGPYTRASRTITINRDAPTESKQ